MRTFLLLLILTGISINVSAQIRYIVKTSDYVTSQQLHTSILPQIDSEELKFKSFRTLVPSLVKRNEPSFADKIFFINKPSDISKDAFLKILDENELIEIAEEEIVYETFEVTSDSLNSNQYYLEMINAFEAWDISKSSSDVIIGIVDSGIDLDHEDLKSKLAQNTDEIPSNGIDDDGDGFIDNVNGWDFAGPDINNIYYGGDPEVGIIEFGSNHGTMVSGVAAAATNNNTGISGVGYNASLLITKHSYDNQDFLDGRLFFVMAGVLYMIEQGVDIVNMSFGSTRRSEIFQQIIDYGHEKGVLFVAAAGNSGYRQLTYPAALDGVIAVTSSDENDEISTFSTFGDFIDIIAPGSSIYTTSADNSYTTVDGTSFSSPIVAGALALLKGKYPDFSTRQITELLKISADKSILPDGDFVFNKLYGAGRIDILKALTIKPSAISFSNIKIVNEKSGQKAAPGDTAIVYGLIKNSLWRSTNALTIELSTDYYGINILDNQISPGVIDSSMEFNTVSTPFRLVLNSDIPDDKEIVFRVTYSDDRYSSFEIFSFIFNPTHLNIDQNLISTTVSSKGRIGYDDAPYYSEIGNGFLYKYKNLVSNMGLMMTSNGKLSNNVIRSNYSINDDFTIIDRIERQNPGLYSNEELSGSFHDLNSYSPVGVRVDYRTMVWKEAPNDKYFIVEYEIENQSQEDINDFYLGLFSDWNISIEGKNDRAGYFSEKNINFGYVHNLEENDTIYAAIQPLNGDFNYWAIDNDLSIPGNPWGINLTYSDEEKIESMTSGIGKAKAGDNPEGRDVSHTVSIGPVSIKTGEKVKLAFAVHAGDSLNDVLNSAKAAYNMYNSTFKAPIPVVDTTYVCYGSNAEIIAKGALKYNWYKMNTGGVPVLKNADRIALNNITKDTVLFVSNAENEFESIRTAAVVKVIGNASINLSKPESIICPGDSIQLSLPYQPGNQYQWSTGSNERSITVKEAGLYKVEVSNPEYSCSSIENQIQIAYRSKPTSVMSSNFENTTVYLHQLIEFTDQSIGAMNRYWDFGDGENSIEQNPTRRFKDTGDLSVTLTVTGESGCQDVATTLFKVTDIRTLLDENELFVFPNPSLSGVWKVLNITEDAKQVRVVNLQGNEMLTEYIHDEEEIIIDGRLWPAGIYVLQIFIRQNGIYTEEIALQYHKLIKQ
ncbi:S8 family serine peptidase [Mangrovivirga sp. M17]|uniref:S8 family serine peptidase n=1 Tax=Mangrovivirga halotolerans TaxID=2993936 RepID=A0ABT3RMR0_9BACT|nr:S8 family serine peptidase [Mangrovivirga halotolerans]MCX2742659.1 S8 family serine peptidase [Mangrovivirga halotolerans]